MTFQQGDQITIRPEHCEKYGLSSSKPIRGTIRQVNRKSKSIRVGVFLYNAMYGNHDNLLWLPVDEIEMGWHVAIYEVPILEQIKILALNGATRIIINPEDFDGLVDEYGKSTAEYTLPFAIELWSYAHCPLGRVFPAPELSVLSRRHTYGMMRIPRTFDSLITR